MAAPADPQLSRAHIARIRREVMVFSDAFQRAYVDWYTAPRDITAQDLVELAIAELERLERACQNGGVAELSLATSRRLVRSLLIEIVRQDDLPEKTRNDVRHLLAAGLTLQYLDQPRSRYTQDWFHYHAERWTEAFGHLAGRADLLFLEIGSFEGRSTCWTLEHLLTHPDSRIICVDPFDSFEDQQRNFEFNVRATGAGHKVTRLVGRSQTALPLLPAESFDLIYVDGSHLMLDAMLDAVMSWKLVKPGGIVVFDDYEHGWLPDSTRSPVAPAVDAFLGLVAGDYETVFHDWQVAIRKLEGGRRLLSPVVRAGRAQPPVR